MMSGLIKCFKTILSAAGSSSWKSLSPCPSIIVRGLTTSIKKTNLLDQVIGRRFWNRYVTSSALISTTTTENMASLYQMHRTGPHYKKRSKKSILNGAPQMRGVVLKTLVKKPKKPNSANRKCVLVKLTSGKETVAYVPGEGHNLQEHNVVLVRPGRLQDVIGVKLKVIRGALDCPHVIKKTAM